MPAQIPDAAANPNTSFSSSEDRDRDDATHVTSPVSGFSQISESSNWACQHKIPHEGDWSTAEGVVELLRSFRGGTLALKDSEAEKYTVRLRGEEHRRLCDLLDLEGDPPSDEFGSWVCDNVKWDYWPDAQTFSLRMPAPTVLHDVFSQQVIDLMRDAVTAAGAGKGSLKPLFKLPTLAIQIPGKKRATTRGREQAHTRGSTMRISPDNCLRPTNTRFPPFVLEVGFANPRTEKDAIKIIHRTNGRVSTILLLNIPHRKRELRRNLPGIDQYGLEVVLVHVVVDEDVWAPRVTHRATLSADRVKEDSTSQLPLTLQDFYLEKCPPTPISITHEAIWACLARAVEEQVFDDNPLVSSPQSDASSSGRLAGIKRKAIDTDTEDDDAESDSIINPSSGG